MVYLNAVTSGSLNSPILSELLLLFSELEEKMSCMGKVIENGPAVKNTP